MLVLGAKLESQGSVNNNVITVINMWSVLLILGIHLLLLVNDKPVLPPLLDTLLARMEPLKA